jgi:hypothetical protein
VTGAIADCERVLVGLLGQPVNSLTSLAFVVAGAFTWARSHRIVGAASIATGVGSFLFHGPMPPGAEWAHDVSLAWLLVAVAAVGTAWERWGGLPALAAIGAGLAAVPAAGDPLGVAAAVAAIASVLWRQRTPRTWAALVILGTAAIVGRLAATGGPLCVPDSLFQGHGFWHLGAAFAVALWAGVGTSVENQAMATSS